MGLKGNFLQMLVTVLVMALAWELMETPATFYGKIVICLMVVLISKVLSWILGG